ncbi:MAG: hypothetical protein M3P06_22420 [Acidobacteriota bacterium]|nr:hypothetical protein [Acidobacteriota bacterium]
MRNVRILILATLAMFASVAAHADHYADLYIIPIAGHTPGQNGTNWMSDVAIQNFQSTPLTVQIVVIEAGSSADNVFPLTTPNNAGSATVPAGGSVMIKDILGGHRGATNTTGALLVGADRPFAITSRTYSMSPAGDTVGQTVPPARDFLDNTLSPIDLATATAYVPGLVQNTDFRTNLGFVAANGSGSAETMNIIITIKGADGATLGTRNFTVTPGSVMQTQFSAASITNTNYDVGSATFRIASGSGSVVPYASVIDNRTADAVFVSGVFPQNEDQSAAFGKGTVPSLFRTILDRMSTFQ